MAADSVLISYVQDTKPLAEELTKFLKKKGIRFWVDYEDLQPGREWKPEPDRAIESAQSFVILVDPNSRATPRQETEWSAILKETWNGSGKRLLPVVVGSAESPPFLRDWVSLKIDPSIETRNWTQRVVAALQSNQPETAPSMTAKRRRQRQKRLNEIGRAVQTLQDTSLTVGRTNLVR